MSMRRRYFSGVVSQDYKLDCILKELKELRKEVNLLKKKDEEDLSEFVEFLDKNNELGSQEDLDKIGIQL